MGFDVKKPLSGGVIDRFGGVRGGLSGGSGGFGRKIRLDAGYGSRFRPGLGLRRRGIGGLRGVLRFEPNFRLFPLLLGTYKLLASLVEGAVGGGLVADEDSEVLGDGHLADAVPILGERIALEAESAAAEPLCRVPDYAACSPGALSFTGFGRRVRGIVWMRRLALWKNDGRTFHFSKYD